MSIENYRSGEEKIDSEGKDKKSKDGLLSKIKNTLAIGAVVGMTALSSPDASAENFSANETATDNTKENLDQKIDKTSITNFVEQLRLEAVRTVLSKDEAMYTKTVAKIENFSTRISFSKLSTEDKQAVKETAPETIDILKKIRTSIDGLIKPYQTRINEIEENVRRNGKDTPVSGMTVGEIAGMGIRVQEGKIAALKGLQETIDASINNFTELSK